MRQSNNMLGLENMTDIFEKIRAKAEKNPELSCIIKDSTLSIHPSDPKGFTVWIAVNAQVFTVGFDGWHEEFQDENEALNCFAFGLSDQCRLKVVKRGDAETAWIVESRDGDDWREDSTTGLFIVPFWKKKSIEYRQNKTIMISQPSSECDSEPYRL